MASKSALTRLALRAKSNTALRGLPALRIQPIAISITTNRKMHQRGALQADATISQTSVGTNPMAGQSPTTTQSTKAADTGSEVSHAAFLGEADSDDGFETYRELHGPPEPSLDATNSAYLGEADSDDGFESHKDVHGEKLDSVDASQAAFLGEADSDDGFESQRELDPEKFRHKIEDVSGSAFHGESGEHDR